MTVPFAIDLIRSAVHVSLLVAAPLLATALVVGLLVSVVQAVTQIQEQTLTFIPKLLLIAMVFMMTLPWLIQQLVQYLVGILHTLPSLVA